MSYRVEIDRVLVFGARVTDADVLRELVQATVARELGSLALPAGMTRRASLDLDTASPLRGAPAVANAIASGVAGAVGGRR